MLKEPLSFSALCAASSSVAALGDAPRCLALLEAAAAAEAAPPGGAAGGAAGGGRAASRGLEDALLASLAALPGAPGPDFARGWLALAGAGAPGAGGAGAGGAGAGEPSGAPSLRLRRGAVKLAARAGLVDDAFALLGALVAAEAPLDAGCFDAVVLALLGAGDGARAEEALEWKEHLAVFGPAD